MGTKNLHMVSMWTTHSALRNLCLILASMNIKPNPLTEHCGKINSTLVLSIKIRIIFILCLVGFGLFVYKQTYIL